MPLRHLAPCCLMKHSSLPPPEHAFVSNLETWGSGDQMLDVITLHDGQVVLITLATVVLFESREAFDDGRGGRTIRRT